MRGSRPNATMKRYGLLLLIYALLWPFVAHVQGQCPQQPNVLDVPWAGPDTPWCQVLVIEETSADEMVYTALVAAPDGTLYAARPLLSDVVALRDSDADGFPDTQTVVAEGLTRPSGLAYHEGALYIGAGPRVHRLDADGTLTTVVDDVPWGYTGYWTTSVAVDPSNGDLYVGSGGDTCQTLERGAIYRYSGENYAERTTFATHIGHPADMVFHEGALWAVDSVTSRLLEIEAGARYGACDGLLPQPVLLEADSFPLGLATYSHDLYPDLTGKLLVALGGNHHEPILRGYALVHVDPASAQTERFIPIIADHLGLDFQKVSIQGSGLWPARPYDIAVGPQGWIYYSTGGGRIIGLRTLD